MNPRRATLIIALLILSPALARANAGTPLLLLSMFHLTIGNLIIGIFEGLLIAWIFNARKMRAILWMIVANFVSMAGGLSILVFVADRFNHLLQPIPLYGAKNYLIHVWAVLIGVTYFIEWPFCFIIFFNEKRGWRKAILACLTVQTASYAILLALYLGASPTTVLTQAKIEKNIAFSRNPNAWVYYITMDGGDVWRRRLDGSPAEKIQNARSTDEYDCLYTRPNPINGKWELRLVRSAREARQIKANELILGNFAQRAGQVRAMDDADSKDDDSRLHAEGVRAAWGRGWDDVIDLRSEPKDDRVWYCRPGWWAADGITCFNHKTDEWYRLALETPIMSWYCRSATILPGDQVVYQLDDMIVLLDLNTRQLGVVAMGRGPAVGLD